MTAVVMPIVGYPADLSAALPPTWAVVGALVQVAIAFGVLVALMRR